MVFNFFKESKSVTNSLIEESRQMHPSIKVRPGSNLAHQIKMLDLTEADLAIAQVLKPYISQEIYKIIDGFYKNVEHHPPLIDVINQYSSIENLKQSLRQHVVDIFSGVINEDFLTKRKRIATIHVKIGLAQKWYIASFQKLFQAISEILYEHFESEEDRKQGMQAIYKLLNLEEQIVLEAYDEELMELKEKETEYQRNIVQSIGGTSYELSSMAEQTTASIEEMTAQINMITENSQTGTRMAGKAEQVSEDGREYLNLMRDSLKRLQSGTKIVNDKMINLEKTSQEIKSIIEIVRSIAEQTNLLSLNASIEAARAGEQGRGFSVVADEIRKLAEQTEESVKEVTHLVNETNSQVHDSAVSLQEANHDLDKVQNHMETTESAFEEISVQMKNTKETNLDIQADLESMEGVMENIVGIAISTSSAVEQLNKILETSDE